PGNWEPKITFPGYPLNSGDIKEKAVAYTQTLLCIGSFMSASKNLIFFVFFFSFFSAGLRPADPVWR
ncbi:MAG: hypothetical protein ACRCYJ_10755, partial [Plesiomonas shigelloides]